jgi:hypothetical protein
MVTFTTGIGEDGQIRHLSLRKALELYAGARNKPALIKLLTPIHATGERCDWVRAMVESGDIYRPVAWPPSWAHALLQSVPLLEESGLVVRLPDWWKKRPRPLPIADPPAGGAAGARHHLMNCQGEDREPSSGKQYITAGGRSSLTTPGFSS